MPHHWVIAPPAPQRDDLAERLRVSPLTAQVICNRGLTCPEDAHKFFEPKLSDLHPPDALAGASEAAEIVAQAVAEGRKIVIYGDYDVDGITGTAILWRCLRMAGAEVDYYIPHRVEEGYGLNEQAVRQLGAEGAGLLITVDCGITAVEEVAVAKQLGLQVIITDHHRVPAEVPAADAILHPRLGDYPCPHLSGAGVALKLAWAIGQRFSAARRVTPEFRQFLLDATSLAALGTIADVVPLIGENRVLAKFGLLGLAHSDDQGIVALIQSARLAGQRLHSEHVGFWLAPRLNAAGRLGHAGLAVEMFTKADTPRAIEIANYLEQRNRQRQALERKITVQAKQMVRDHGMDSEQVRAIVLADASWHAGVIGIVAARLVDEFGKPAVLVTFESNGGEPIGQGSGRSISGFALDEALAACSEHLLSHGGHAMAAGLKLRRERFEPFAEAFLQYAQERLKPEDMAKTIRLDAEIDLAVVTPALIAELNRLGPFGMGNPKPKFATGWLRLAAEPRVVGRNGEHLQMLVTDGKTTRKAVGFGLAKHLGAITAKEMFRLAFEPIANEFNGSVNAELKIIDFQVAE